MIDRSIFSTLSVEDKQELVKHLLSLQPNGQEAPLPLTHGQASLWFLHQLAPASPAYNFLYAARIPAAVHVDFLRRACQQLLDRHPALRTRFLVRDHKPIQQVEREVVLDLPVTDASSWSEEQLLEMARQRADVPFDLGRAPCLRIELFRRSSADFLLLLTFHHLIADLWSADLLIHELRLLYLALREGRPSPLPPVSANFADYVRWETVYAYSERGLKDKRYWHNLLAGELPVLDLPADRPRPPVQTYNGTAHSWTLDPDVAGKLRLLAEKHSATRFMVLLAAFGVFLHRLSGQHEILIGTPVAGRDRPEWERLVGYFLNQVVVRSSFAPERSFRQLLDDTRQQVLQAMEHQAYPFGQLVKELQVKRDPARSPLFQAMFVWDKPRDTDTPVGATLPVNPMLMEQRGAPFDLTLILFELGEKLVASLRYSSALFDPATIRRWASHFDTLLASLTASPDLPLSEAEILSSLEKRQILIEWSRTEAAYPSSCFHELFEQHVRKAPGATALLFEGASCRYDEVNRRANRLARRLRSTGTQPGGIVAISLPRGPDLIVSILAVWKAGAAFVFLDPTEPARRREAILADAHPVAGIALASTAALPVPTVTLDQVWPDLEKLDSSDLSLPLSADQPAYIIYTSGSTGEPKGVVLRHRGLCNVSAAQQASFGVGPADRVLQFASLSFDASLFELAMALGSGATLVLGSAAALLPGPPLWELLHREQISNVTLPPSVLAMLPLEPLPALRTLIVAGETCSAELVSSWAPGRRFFNAYGPTETTIWATLAECQAGRIPTIGRPIANTRVYVVDSQLEPVPVGVAGELYVAGAGVALGYLNRPELTAERFLPNPFDQADEAVLYRTGDMARWTPEGELEFLGRSDHQVKIRGHRIELEEIQEVLRRHPDVTDAAVVVRRGADGTPSLAAYVVGRDRTALSIPAVRQHLRERLPRYMLPTAVVPLDSLPLGTTGKLDRSRLPNPMMAVVPAESPETPADDPRGGLEQILAGIWSRVLKVERVGVHDHFFELGGASTQTLEVSALAREQGLPVTPELLFRHQTIAELAAALAESNGSTSPEPAALAPEQSLVHSATTSQEAASTPSEKHTQPGALIESIGVYLPEKALSTAEVLAGCRKKIEFPLERLTGIRSRRIAGDTEFSLALAEKATADCLRRAPCADEEIDLLISCNISRCSGPYQFSLEPSTAAHIARRFGLVNAVAFDLTNACAGTFTAILVANAFIRQGIAKRALIVSGEYITHLTRTAQEEIDGFMDPRLPCLTLGDSGVALLLGPAPSADVGFQELELYTLGKYHHLCVAKLSSMTERGPVMLTDSVTSTVVTIKQAVGHAAEVLRRRRWDAQTVKGLVIHQTSETTLDGAVQEINRALGQAVCHRGNTLYNVAERGNTATNTHFLAVWEAIQAGRFASGDRLVFAVSGSGQTVGTSLYVLDDLPERLRQSAPAGQLAAARQAGELRHFRCRRRICLESIATMEGDANAGGSAQVSDGRLSSIELVRKVGESCLQQSARPREEIDLVLYTGVYRSEFLAEPSMASIAAGELAINHDDRQLGARRTLAFDVLNGGGGTLTACFLASQMIEANEFSRALVIASEVQPCRELWPPSHRGRAEAASALVLEVSGDEAGFTAFGYRAFPEHLEAASSATGVQENAAAIFHHRSADLEDREVECATQAVRELLTREALTPEELSLFVPPQRPGSLGFRLAELLGIAPAKVVDIAAEQDYFTSSLAFAFQKLRQEGRLAAGARVLLVEVAAGLQVWCALYTV
jgi:amino acid adenylation domain-containing protein